MKNEIIVNLSRIGKNGSGLFIFSKSLVKCLSSSFENISIVAPDCIDIDNIATKYQVPNWVAMASSVSIIRPILWFIYSTLFFPFKNSRILSTTHHAVPGAKNQIITIHDLRPYFMPDSILQKIYFKYMLPRYVHKVAGILTVSETTKQLIVECYDIVSEKIHVVPNCVDITLFKPTQTSLSTDKPYLLMVGSTWKHKNAHELIERSTLWTDKYRLKILAGHGKYKESLYGLVNNLNLKDKVDFVGYLSDSELIMLYQNASALIYPSLMEGFGIPPIEAMACGVPVIVSDISVFRETYGDVPIYVELGNSSSWEYAFNLLNNQDVIALKINRGLQKATEYSEERMCASLVKAITTIWPDCETI